MFRIPILPVPFRNPVWIHDPITETTMFSVVALGIGMLKTNAHDRKDASYLFRNNDLGVRLLRFDSE